MNSRKLKILFIVILTDGMHERLEELGISYIAAVLRQNDNEVMIISSRKERIDYQKIYSFKPDIVGMTIYDINKNNVYEVCQELKQAMPSVLICAGGTTPTYNGDIILEEEPAIEYIIRGEGELVFLDLVNHLEQGIGTKKIKGLMYREDGKIVSNPDQQYIDDLNKLPFPARDILMENNLNIAQISTSRGCTSRCSFCSSQLFWKKWRGRDVKNIVDEIESIVTQYGIKLFNFIDSSFEDPGVKYGRIEQIAQEIINRNLNIVYFADVRAESYRYASQELIDLLKCSGLITVMVGFETGNEYDLKVYNKRATLDDNRQCIEFLRKNGIIVKCGFINFNPYSTFEGLKANIDFLEKYGYAYDLECIATKYSMFKGTSLYNRVVEDSLTRINDSNELEYNFVNPAIEPLADYVCNYLKQNNETGDSFKKIRYFNVYFPGEILTFKKLLDSNEDKDAYELFLNFEKEYMPQINEICENMNKCTSKWFRELVALAEKQWNNKSADEVSNKYLNSRDVKKIADSLVKMKIKLYMSLSKLNLKYCKYIPQME